MSLEERIARVEDRDQIRETIARYAHGLDLPDRDVFASVWTPDAVYRVDEPFGEVRGIEAITAAWDTFQTIFIDMHHHTMNVIVDGPDGDRASSVSFALVTGTDSEGTAWTASCIYYDQFQKIDGQWLFTERYDKVNYMVPVAGSTWPGRERTYLRQSRRDPAFDRRWGGPPSRRFAGLMGR